MLVIPVADLLISTALLLCVSTRKGIVCSTVVGEKSPTPPVVRPPRQRHYGW